MGRLELLQVLAVHAHMGRLQHQRQIVGLGDHSLGERHDALAFITDDRPNIVAAVLLDDVQQSPTMLKSGYSLRTAAHHSLIGTYSL